MTLPIIGAALPRRGNRFSRWLGCIALAFLGWRVRGVLPDLSKLVIVGAPHTSNMDGVIALIALAALRLRASIMIKDSAFVGVLGVGLRWLGGIPVNRRSPKKAIEQAVTAFANSTQMIMLIAPEGTRTGTGEWKRGFYRIAERAGAPIVAAAFDYRCRVIRFGPVLWPSGNYDADLAVLLRFYREHGVARHREHKPDPLRDVAGKPARREGATTE